MSKRPERFDTPPREGGKKVTPVFDRTRKDKREQKWHDKSKTEKREGARKLKFEG